MLNAESLVPQVANSAKNQTQFQEIMSNTAHQREIEDLKAAGLNPVLSAGGTGASTPSGNAGDFDRHFGHLVGAVSSGLDKSAKALKTATDTVAKLTSADLKNPHETDFATYVGQASNFRQALIRAWSWAEAHRAEQREFVNSYEFNPNMVKPSGRSLNQNRFFYHTFENPYGFLTPGDMEEAYSGVDPIYLTGARYQIIRKNPRAKKGYKFSLFK